MMAEQQAIERDAAKAAAKALAKAEAVVVTIKTRAQKANAVATHSLFLAPVMPWLWPLLFALKQGMPFFLTQFKKTKITRFRKDLVPFVCDVFLFTEHVISVYIQHCSGALNSNEKLMTAPNTLSLCPEEIIPGCSVRITADGLLYAVDLVMVITRTSKNEAFEVLRRLSDEFFLESKLI
jgi:hypothetical protein